MTNEKTKKSFLDQFKIQDPESCLLAIKNGWVAGLISIGLTILIVALGMFSGSDNATLAYFADPSMIVDIVLMVIPLKSSP